MARASGRRAACDSSASRPIVTVHRRAAGFSLPIPSLRYFFCNLLFVSPFSPYVLLRSCFSLSRYAYYRFPVPRSTRFRERNSCLRRPRWHAAVPFYVCRGENERRAESEKRVKETEMRLTAPRLETEIPAVPRIRVAPRRECRFSHHRYRLSSAFPPFLSSFFQSRSSLCSFSFSLILSGMPRSREIQPRVASRGVLREMLSDRLDRRARFDIGEMTPPMTPDFNPLNCSSYDT